MENLACEFIPDGPNYDLNFKLIVIGDSGVGKSCITTRATKDMFLESYSATIGFEFFSLCVKINEKNIKLQIWDTCGQEIYRSLISSFYKNSSLAILVYAINDMNSFNNLNIWLNEIKIQSNPDIKIILIGNKEDLKEEREVETEKGEQFKNENQFDLFMESSAKSGSNCKNIFMEAAKMLYIDHLNYKDRSMSKGSLSDMLDEKKNNEKKKKKKIKDAVANNLYIY